MQMSRAIETDGDMIVKRVSVPLGLEELMDGLTKEVLIKKPKDIYIFASEYFANLLQLREKNTKKGFLSIRKTQSVVKLDKKLTVNANPKTKSLEVTRKQLTRQQSVRAQSPIRKALKKPDSLPNNERFEKNKQIIEKHRSKRSIKSDKTSENSTPRSVRDRSESKTRKERQEVNAKLATPRGKSQEVGGIKVSGKKLSRAASESGKLGAKAGIATMIVAGGIQAANIEKEKGKDEADNVVEGRGTEVSGRELTSDKAIDIKEENNLVLNTVNNVIENVEEVVVMDSKKKTEDLPENEKVEKKEVKTEFSLDEKLDVGNTLNEKDNDTKELYINNTVKKDGLEHLNKKNGNNILEKLADNDNEETKESNNKQNLNKENKLEQKPKLLEQTISKLNKINKEVVEEKIGKEETKNNILEKPAENDNNEETKESYNKQILDKENKLEQKPKLEQTISELNKINKEAVEEKMEKEETENNILEKPADNDNNEKTKESYKQNYDIENKLEQKPKLLEQTVSELNKINKEAVEEKIEKEETKNNILEKPADNDNNEKTKESYKQNHDIENKLEKKPKLLEPTVSVLNKIDKKTLEERNGKEETENNILEKPADIDNSEETKESYKQNHDIENKLEQKPKLLEQTVSEVNKINKEVVEEEIEKEQTNQKITKIQLDTDKNGLEKTTDDIFEKTKNSQESVQNNNEFTKDQTKKGDIVASNMKQNIQLEGEIQMEVESNVSKLSISDDTKIPEEDKEKINAIAKDIEKLPNKLSESIELPIKIVSSSLQVNNYNGDGKSQKESNENIHEEKNVQVNKELKEEKNIDEQKVVVDEKPQISELLLNETKNTLSNQQENKKNNDMKNESLIIKSTPEEITNGNKEKSKAKVIDSETILQTNPISDSKLLLVESVIVEPITNETKDLNAEDNKDSQIEESLDKKEIVSVESNQVLESKLTNFDSSKLRQELEVATNDAQKSFKSSFNPLILKQEIKQAVKMGESVTTFKLDDAIAKATAARKIQALWRGFSTRKARDTKNQTIADKPKNTGETVQIEDAVLQAIAAQKIQSLWRGYSKRKARKIEADNAKTDVSDQFRMASAVLTIQKLWRGFQVRKLKKRGALFGNKIENQARQEDLKSTMEKPKSESAALKIQALWRGYKSRQNYNEVNARLSSLQTDEAQSQKGILDSELFKAATKIQAGIRGFMVRKKRNTHLNSITEERASVDDQIIKAISTLEAIPIESPKAIKNIDSSKNKLFKTLSAESIQMSQLEKLKTNSLETNQNSNNFEQHVMDGKKPVSEILATETKCSLANITSDANRIKQRESESETVTALINDDSPNKTLQISYEDAPTRPVTSDIVQIELKTEGGNEIIKEKNEYVALKHSMVNKAIDENEQVLDSITQELDDGNAVVFNGGVDGEMRPLSIDSDTSHDSVATVIFNDTENNFNDVVQGQKSGIDSDLKSTEAKKLLEVKNNTNDLDEQKESAAEKNLDALLNLSDENVNKTDNSKLVESILNNNDTKEENITTDKSRQSLEENVNKKRDFATEEAQDKNPILIADNVVDRNITTNYNQDVNEVTCELSIENDQIVRNNSGLDSKLKRVDDVDNTISSIVGNNEMQQNARAGDTKIISSNVVLQAPLNSNAAMENALQNKEQLVLAINNDVFEHSDSSLMAQANNGEEGNKIQQNNRIEEKAEKEENQIEDNTTKLKTEKTVLKPSNILEKLTNIDENRQKSEEEEKGNDEEGINSLIVKTKNNITDLPSVDMVSPMNNDQNSKEESATIKADPELSSETFKEVAKEETIKKVEAKSSNKSNTNEAINSGTEIEKEQETPLKLNYHRNSHTQNVKQEKEAVESTLQNKNSDNENKHELVQFNAQQLYGKAALIYENTAKKNNTTITSLSASLSHLEQDNKQDKTEKLEHDTKFDISSLREELKNCSEYVKFNNKLLYSEEINNLAPKLEVRKELVNTKATDNKFDISKLRDEIFESDKYELEEIQAKAEILFNEKSGDIYIPLRELSDIKEEDTESKASPEQGNPPKTDVKVTNLLHSGELHDSVTLPLTPPSSSRDDYSQTDVSQAATAGLVNTGELHDNVLPLTVQLNDDAPAGPSRLTSSKSISGSNGAQASNKDASTWEIQPDKPTPLPISSMETEKRNNASLPKKSNMEVEAATKIQAGFRGYQVRKQLKNKISAPGDISNQRRSARRKSSGRMTDSSRISTPKKSSNDLEEKSAVKIQAGVRGFLVRRRQKKQKEDGDDESS